MDIFEEIVSDHETVAEILEELEDTTPHAVKTRQRGLERLSRELVPHIGAEEETLYPALERAGEQEAREHVYEAIDEHRLARMVHEELRAMDVQDEHWGPKLKVLKDLVEHHVEEEEGDLFQSAREALDERELDRLAGQFREAKGRHAAQLGSAMEAGRE